jgi:hypothetical protein
LRRPAGDALPADALASAQQRKPRRHRMNLAGQVIGGTKTIPERFYRRFIDVSQTTKAVI